MGVQNYLLHKIERLKPESKNFTKKVSGRYIALFTNPHTAPKGTFMKMKTFVFETFKMYDELNETAKNPRFRNYMRRVFDNADVKRAFNRADRMINPKQ
ncbi:unnamed protein product [Gongylonema pulchrum]|uniref:YgiQ family radical SAM protein n=1 Tax=Gongylonema pulchrum TaxID=637853 RepID=A0A183D3I8_9BILA|nr:unnamed protein product [Gongylonema pulchrum]